MIRLIVACLFLTCTASLAFAETWTLTITGSGTKPTVTFTDGTGQTPPPTTPPPTTPPPTTPPPDTTPPPSTEPGDDLPFVFPPQPNPPGLLNKYYWVGYDPTTQLSLYEANPLEADPLPATHRYAGQVLAGTNAGLSIWAPVGVLRGTIRILVNGGTLRP